MQNSGGGAEWEALLLKISNLYYTARGRVWQFFQQKKSKMRGLAAQSQIIANYSGIFSCLIVQLAEIPGDEARFFVNNRRAESDSANLNQEESSMNQAAQNVMKTAAVGVVLGTAAGVAMNAGHRRTANMKKKAAKAMRVVGHTSDSISRMM